MQQAAMRSGSRRERRILRDLERRAEASARRVDEQPPELKKLVAATIWAYGRRRTAAQIAANFDWEPKDVQRWLDAGAPLLINTGFTLCGTDKSFE